MKLNLGCGDFPLAGFTNVDFRALPSVDVVADVRALPFADESAEEVYAGHLLEHFPEADGAAILAEWWRVVAPCGSLTVVIPDCIKTKQWWRQGHVTEAWYRHVLNGDSATKGMSHHAQYDAASLRWLMEQLPGLAKLREVALTEDRRLVSAIGWQSGWTAVKEVA